MKEIKDDKLKEALQKELNQIAHHFMTDGWDLSLSNCIENILYEYFGFHLSDMFLKEVGKFKGNYGLRIKKHVGTVISDLNNKYIYYDIKNDKIIETNSTFDFCYDTKPEQYYYLGKLDGY